VKIFARISFAIRRASMAPIPDFYYSAHSGALLDLRPIPTWMNFEFLMFNVEFI
jgi:hypothetical protein